MFHSSFNKMKQKSYISFYKKNYNNNCFWLLIRSLLENAYLQYFYNYNSKYK